MSETIALELYCIGSSLAIKAKTLCITKAKLGLDFPALIPHKSSKGNGALEMDSNLYPLPTEGYSNKLSANLQASFG